MLVLSKIRRKNLRRLADGEMMTITNENIAFIDGVEVSQDIRYFFTSRRLVTRKDKSKHIQIEGNGFIITDRGRHVLAGQLEKLGEA